MKRRLLITAVAMLSLSLTVYATMAYLTSNTTAHNVITSGNVKIELLDKTVAGGNTIDFPEAGLQVMPGTTASKEVSVKNLANTSWIRVYLDQQILLSDKSLASQKAISEAILLNLDTENWIQGSDGFYYYKKALEKDQTTKPLFTKVTFDSSMGNEYQNSLLTIRVFAQAVQTANNGVPAGGDVTKVKGWPASEGIPKPEKPKSAS